jgi:outer membrane protein OmpA-like peptidoglycan-associated protein
LSGNSPNEYQRQRAEEIAAQVSPGTTIDNAIIADAASPFPILLRMRAEEIVAILNTVNGIYLEPHFQNGDLLLTGVAADSSLLEHITRTFENLAGLQTFTIQVKTGEMEIARRLLFDLNSVTIRLSDRLVPALVKSVLDRTPWSKLKIIGHSDEIGGEVVNRRIATGRAAAVQLALRRLNVRSDRILIEGRPGPPTESAANGADSLNRCVRCILVPTHSRGAE